MVIQKTNREIEVEKFITHRSWRKYLTNLKGPRGEVKAEADRKAGPGGHAFIRVCGWSALGFQD